VSNFLDLKNRLRASSEASAQKFSIYIADKDENNEDVPDIGDWITGAISLLTEINGGSTKIIAQGTWKSDNGTVTNDATSIIYSFIDPETFFRRLDDIVYFLHDYGKRTSQGAVMVEFSGEDEEGIYQSRAYFIEKADYISA